MFNDHRTLQTMMQYCSITAADMSSSEQTCQHYFNRHINITAVGSRHVNITAVCSRHVNITAADMSSSLVSLCAAVIRFLCELHYICSHLSFVIRVTWSSYNGIFKHRLESEFRIFISSLKSLPQYHCPYHYHHHYHHYHHQVMTWSG